MNKLKKIMTTHQGAIDALFADCKANGVNIVLVTEMDTGDAIVGASQADADTRNTSNVFDAALFFAQRGETAQEVSRIVPVIASAMLNIERKFKDQTEDASPMIARKMGLQ